jgi:hypothetical protein
MQSFKNLAEGTFDEAFAKIVHTKLYQIRLLRHNHVGALQMAQTLESLGLLMIGLAKNGAGTFDIAMHVDIG